MGGVGDPTKKSLAKRQWAIILYSTSKLLPELNKISFHKFDHFVWQISGHVSQPSLSSLTWW